MVKKKDNECNLCNKDRGNYEGLIWFSGDIPTYLCRGCYMKFCRIEVYKKLKEKYKETKPCTKRWTKMCKEEQKAFDKWYYDNGGVDEGVQS